MEEARSEYAAKLIDWKNKNREKKKFFAGMASDLGFERQMPQSEKSQELRDAEDAYISAKKKKNFHRDNYLRKYSDLESKEVNQLVFNNALLNEAEIEWDILQQKITESLPPLEKGIAAKLLGRWAKWPMLVRLALSTVLITGTSLAFG